MDNAEMRALKERLGIINYKINFRRSASKEAGRNA